MDALRRSATLIPKELEVRFDGNKSSVKYNVQDDVTQLSAGEIWIVFQPSKELIGMLKSEIDKAINDRWQNEKAKDAQAMLSSQK